MISSYYLLIAISSYYLERDGCATTISAGITRYVANAMVQTKSLMKKIGILSIIEVTDFHIDINKDKDEIIESEFFDTRQAFLSLCQGNHYQFDTLRWAKHSSMMILYHLHHPTTPAFVSTCNVCHHDIETG